MQGPHSLGREKHQLQIIFTCEGATRRRLADYEPYPVGGRCSKIRFPWNANRSKISVQTPRQHRCECCQETFELPLSAWASVYHALPYFLLTHVVNLRTRRNHSLHSWSPTQTRLVSNLDSCYSTIAHPIIIGSTIISEILKKYRMCMPKSNYSKPRDTTC